MMISWLLFTEVGLSRFLHDDAVEDGGEDADEDEDAEDEVLLFVFMVTHPPQGPANFC